MKKHKLLWASLLATLGISLMATAAAAVTVNSTIYIDNDDIDVNDGTLNDWPVDSQVVDESDAGDVEGNTWCWDAGAEGWDSETPEETCNTFWYNGDASMDILTGYFGVNDENFLMGIETAVPMMSVLNMVTDEYVEFWMMPYVANAPSSIPEDYDHSMVFAFGPDDEETFSYYVVADLFVPQDLDLEEGSDVTLTIYQESGDTVGYQEDEDTSIGELDPNDGETTGDDGETSFSTIFEVKQNIEAFFALTNFTYESYGFRFETHSSYADVSDRVVVDFAATGAPAKLKKSEMRTKKLQKKQVNLKWDEVTYADTYTVQLRKCKNDTKKKCSKAKHFQKKAKYRKFKSLTGTKKTVKKLKKGTYYQWRIRATNVVGTAEFSKWERFKTKG